MRMCCRDMARLLNSDFVRIGHPLAGNLAGSDLSGVYAQSDRGEWLLMRFCPFCGQSALVEFEDDHTER